MKIKLAVAIVILSAFFCCTQKKEPQQFSDSNTEQEKIDTFFPVTSFLKGQLMGLDSLPITPLYKITIKDKTDSSWLKKEALRSLLQPFISQEIGGTNLTSFYKESKFSDLSLNAITFTYDPIAPLPDSLSITHWDVYIDPETGKVFKLYLVKRERNNITQQLTWQTDKWAKIVSIDNKADGSAEIVKEEQFIWSF